MRQTIQVNLKENALEIRLNRPQVKNAFNEVMIRELAEVFAEEVKKPTVRAVVLRGEGDLFCAGGDLAWMKRSIEMSDADNFRETRGLTDMFRLMNECPKPLIGAVHGAAIGGGVGLVSVCDWVIASKETQLSLSEVRLGIIPACIGPFVISKIGASYARGYFMSAERFSAQRAYEIGLVHEVVATPADLDVSLARILKNMSQCGPNAMAAAKSLVLDLSWPEKRAAISDCYSNVAQRLCDLRVSPEGQEGLKAFLEKRKPNWQNQG